MEKTRKQNFISFEVVFLIAFLLLLSNRLYSQLQTGVEGLEISGYLETYYAYDIQQPENELPGFLYNFNRQNEVNLNFGFLQAAYTSDKIRGEFALMAGTYANSNLADESGVLKNIFRANIGVKLAKEKSLWLDVGVFDSPIGFESAIGAQCYNLTRSLVAENSPYYFAGAKLTYQSADEKWLLSGMYVNGWQRIERVPGNSTPAFGHQVRFAPSNKISFHSNSFIGNDYPDEARKMRYFHNFFSQLQLSEKASLIVGFDTGFEQQEKNSSQYYVWYAPVVVGQYRLTEKSRVGVRAEYFMDENQVIVNTDTPNGFQTFGYSLNYDYQITTNAVWRTEARSFSAKDAIFGQVTNASTSTFIFTTSLAFSF
ncbi:MAG: porin [Bacteroidota bacterium]